MKQRRSVLTGLLLTSLAISACGNSQEPRSATTAQKPTSSTSSSTTSARRHQRSPATVPTRLVGGPIVFRVKGATHEPLMRYVLIFRLNRPYPRWPKDPKDPDGPAPLPPGAAEPLGNISINGFRFDFDRSIFNFDPVKGADADNCFFGRIDTDLPDVVRRLDKIPNGDPVRVRLHLLTAKPPGTPTWGRLYIRHPKMILTQVKPYTGIRYSDGLYMQIVSRAALAALKRAGCAETILY